jgi:two-component sensor histidine kinase
MREDLQLDLGGGDSHQDSTSPLIGVMDAPDRFDAVEEADHRIANHLALLTSYVRLQAAELAGQCAEPSRDSVRLLLASVGAQIDSVARLHRSLAASGRREEVELSEHLHAVCAPFASGLSGASELFEDFQDGCVVRPDHVLPLTQIVAEVITNAVKHAHTDGEAGVILARCGKDEAGAVTVEVINDGTGLPEAFNPDTDGGIGFRLLRTLGKQLGALIAFESCRDGLCFRLTLPAARD